MTLGNFIQAHNGLKNFDYDGAAGSQCVDLVKLYLDKVYGIRPGAWGDARKYYEAPNPTLLARFDRIAYRPGGPLPSPGDIIMWSGSLPNSGGAGHVAVVVSANPGSFVSFDNNWGGKYFHHVTHNYSYVLGWLTPKTTNRGEEFEMIKNEDMARKVYYMLRTNKAHVTNQEIQATAGRRSFEEFVNSAQTEVEIRNQNIAAQEQHMANMQATINAQNETITKLQLTVNDAHKSNAEKNAALDKAMVDLANQNAALAVAHDTIEDLKKEPISKPPATPTGSPKVDLATRLLAWLTSRKKP